MMLDVPYKRLEEADVSVMPDQPPKLCVPRSTRRLVMPFLCLLLVGVVSWNVFPVFDLNDRLPMSKHESCATSSNATSNTTIFVITPTHKRVERIADMTRFSQTLMLIPDIVWVVVEDAVNTSPPVERLLERTGISYVYLHTVTGGGLPSRGWTHRNFALDYLRKNYADYEKNAVVYFADDDNAYDIRLFNDYIRNVKTIGVWAVGLSGGAKVEAPHVENGVITKWNAVYRPNRAYAVDMAGFAVNFDMILKTNASFGKQCIGHDPENCFLQQFKIPKEDAQAFGWDTEPKEILAWHTRTSSSSAKGDDYGYTFEAKNSTAPKAG